MKKYKPEQMLDDELDQAIEELGDELKTKKKDLDILEDDYRLLVKERQRRQAGEYLPIHEQHMIDFELSLVKKPRKIQ